MALLNPPKNNKAGSEEMGKRMRTSWRYDSFTGDSSDETAS